MGAAKRNDLNHRIVTVAMTPEEWDRGDSFIAEIARRGKLLYEAAKR
jgi:hypothetical protein